MKLFIILCMQFLAVNIAYATNLNGNANLNGNLNNNRNNNRNNNANINALIPILKSDTSISNDNRADFPVSTANAPMAISTSDCLGSVSAGGQGQFMGFSLGFSKQSKPCNIRAYAKMFRHMPAVYNAILCQDDIVREAFRFTDYQCPEKPKKKKDWIKYEYPRGR